MNVTVLPYGGRRANCVNRTRQRWIKQATASDECKRYMYCNYGEAPEIKRSVHAFHTIAPPSPRLMLVAQLKQN